MKAELMREKRRVEKEKKEKLNKRLHELTKESDQCCNDQVSANNQKSSKKRNSSDEFESPRKILRSNSNLKNLPQRNLTPSPAKKIVSHGVEMRLRKKINSLKNELKQEKAASEKWKAKFLKVRKVNLVNRIKFKQQNRSLLRQVQYSKNLISSIKHRIAASKFRSKDKKKIALIVSGGVDNRRRAPTTSLSLHEDHYYRVYMTPGALKKSKTQLDREKKVSEIEDFFADDSNTCPATGSRGFATKNSITRRIRYLSGTFKELHKKFCAGTGRNISLDNFKKLRPFWVKKRPNYTRDTCLCKDHTNFELMLKKLHYYKVTETPNVREFMTSICCDIRNEKCVYQECSKCKEVNLFCTEPDKKISYESWVRRTDTRQGAKGKTFVVNLTEKTKIECTLETLIKKFQDSIPKFFQHQFRTWHQFEALSKTKKSLKKKEVYIVSDFSQNYEGKYSRQIHSAHFGASKKQISILTGGFYYLNESDNLCFSSFASVSDCLNHESHAVWAMLNPAISQIKKVVPDVEKIIFQSDGPTAQVKNKNMFFLLNHFCKKLKIKKAIWNFTAAGHGKSAADGIGGCVKSICNREVLLGRDVLTAQNIVDVLREKSDILSFCVDKETIDEYEKLIPSGLKPVAKTMLVHQVVWDSGKPNELGFRYLSCNDCDSNVDCIHFNLPESKTRYFTELELCAGSSKKQTPSLNSKNSTPKYKKGDWIAVIFDQWYPGQIIQVNEKGQLVTKFMCRSQKFFYWPKQQDVQKLYESQVLCLIQEPTKQKTGKFYYLSEENLTRIEDYAENCVIYEEEDLAEENDE